VGPDIETQFYRHSNLGHAVSSTTLAGDVEDMKRARIAILVAVLTLAVVCAIAIAQEQPSPALAQSAGFPQAAAPPSPAPDAVPAPANPPGKIDAAPENYLIQTEDILRMSVLGEPELVTEQVVDPKGDINIPLAGTIHAVGLTRQQLTDTITLALSKYLVEPKVQLTLSQYRRARVYVMGMVNRPGVVELKPGDRVMEAIAQAGSFTREAYLEGSMITATGSQESVKLDLHKLFYQNDMTQNVSLHDGDTIYVPENLDNKYFVLGEVARPGPFPLKEHVTIIDAITGAGGATPRARANTTFIIRGKERIKVDISRFLKSADLSQNIALMAGDVVYVPETNKPDWNKISGIISVIVNSSYLARTLGL
jgi:polysaccharide export outer membrane protein